MATKDKPNNKNLRALFSVICLCIIALGLIVYFSTQSARVTDVNEKTSVKETITASIQEKTTEVQRRVTVKETVTQKKTTAAESTKKKAVTEKPTMEQTDTNTPYKSFYKYPAGETALNGYTQELVLNETMGDYRSHTAIDFKCSVGEKIVSINDGRVMSVTKNELLGKIVEIDHGGKLVAKYCGLETVNVSAGDYVTIGQNIGTVGVVPFEASSESHLHFETLVDGKYVNPLDVMGKTE
ncbi:MAG: peptidoglycan DD-metalloendopeptidase family protein [Acetobacter sp.]|nr:peptidoglycan DD-metalloendopeptidase family protein [Bacteroides sp.]MCM1341715.1 peptidoglycan DD-metalloendopeptidase family protein [Acetobacter sp.]MCM1432346.1 peptidoglycan DD-metalloendopeptidase family protein [Clostridiales bacterium]